MLTIFAIYDEKAEAFLPPFFLPKRGMAVRVFADCINSATHQFGQNPADYTLFELGNFDDENGQLLVHRAKTPLGNGVEFRLPDHPISPELPENGQDQSSEPLSNGAPILPGAESDNPA